MCVIMHIHDYTSLSLNLGWCFTKLIQVCVIQNLRICTPLSSFNPKAYPRGMGICGQRARDGSAVVGDFLLWLVNGNLGVEMGKLKIF